MQRPYSAQHNNDKLNCPAAKKLKVNWLNFELKTIKEPNFKKSQMRFESHLDNLMLANKDYFDHIAQKCICAICTCGFHKCNASRLKLDHQKNDETMYNTHYAYNPARAKSLSKQMFKPELWNTPSIKNPIEYSTTYRNNYQRPLTAIPSVQQKDVYSQTRGKLPFTAVTHYEKEFQKWPESKATLIEPQPNQTVIKDLPFSSSTSYNKDYAPKIIGKGDKEIEKLLNNAKFSKFKSPIGQDIPLMATTTMQNAFMPYKTFTYNNKRFNSRPSLKLPAYAQQYQTQYKKDYDEKDKKDCPASYYDKIKNV